jgi:hypothetical protein
MLAYQQSGDYHDNFDSDIYFKWMSVVYYTYPDWCRQQQRKKDAGTVLFSRRGHTILFGLILPTRSSMHQRWLSGSSPIMPHTITTVG